MDESGTVSKELIGVVTCGMVAVFSMEMERKVLIQGSKWSEPGGYEREKTRISDLIKSPDDGAFC